MINTKQEKEDNYFMVMSAMLLFSALCLYTIFYHGDTGLKYMLLKNFGVQTRGIVASIEPGYPSTIKEQYSVLLRNSEYGSGYKLVEISYSPLDGVSEAIRIPVLEDDQTFSLNQFVSVLYLGSNPKIAHTETTIEEFSFDAALFKSSVVALATALVIGVFAFRRWRRFKVEMRNY